MIRCVGRASKATGVSGQFESPSHRDEDSLESIQEVGEETLCSYIIVRFSYQ